MVNPTCPHVTRTRVTRPPGADLGESNRNSVPLVGLPMDGASMVQLRVRRVVGGEVPQTRLWKHPSPGTLGLHMTRSPRRRRARTEIVLSRRAWLVSRSGQNNGTCHRRCVSRGRSTWPFDHAQHMGNARHGAHARRRRQGRARRARRRGCNCSESRGFLSSRHPLPCLPRLAVVFWRKQDVGVRFPRPARAVASAPVNAV